MFTGIIEEIGKILKKNRKGEGIEFYISSSVLLREMSNGDSISVNGVCQTVEKKDDKGFYISAVEETLKKTNLGLLNVNSFVNLESSLTLNKKISGHLVYGHVDCTGKITKIINKNLGIQVLISYPKEYNQYLIHVGSISINGISLTVSNFKDNQLEVSIIPHTWENTVLKYAKIGDLVNLEFDIIGKYVEKFVKKSNGNITESMLKNLGY